MPVEVTASRVVHGLAVEIEDCGVGMNQDQYTEANLMSANWQPTPTQTRFPPVPSRAALEPLSVPSSASHVWPGVPSSADSHPPALPRAATGSDSPAGAGVAAVQQSPRGGPPCLSPSSAAADVGSAAVRAG